MGKKNNYKVLFVILLFSLLTAYSNQLFSQWIHMSNGLGSVAVYSMIVKGDKIFAGTFNQGIYVSTDNGENWTQSGLQGETVFRLYIKDNYIIVGTLDNGIYVSKNDGLSWVQSNLTNRRVTCFAPYNGLMLAGTLFYGIHTSTDNGLSWERIPNTLLYVYDILVLGNNIFAANRTPFEWGLYLSTDNGSNFSQTALNTEKVASLEYNAASNTMYAGTDFNGLFMSNDMGVSWSVSSLTARSVQSLWVNNDKVFAGTYLTGVFVSGDNGITWLEKNQGLPAEPTVNSFILHNGYVFAATSNNAVYRIPLEVLVGVNVISAEVPAEYSLSQNYPNPFNPATRIEFAIPKQGNVLLNIYDAKGSLVKTFSEGNLNAGKYSVDFNASGLSSGVYFYSIEAGEFIQTKKMVLVK